MSCAKKYLGLPQELLLHEPDSILTLNFRPYFLINVANVQEIATFDNDDTIVQHWHLTNSFQSLNARGWLPETIPILALLTRCTLAEIMPRIFEVCDEDLQENVVCLSSFVCLELPVSRIIFDRCKDE